MGFMDKLKDINSMRKQAKVMETMLATKPFPASPREENCLNHRRQPKYKKRGSSTEIAGDKAEIARHIRGGLRRFI